MSDTPNEPDISPEMRVEIERLLTMTEEQLLEELAREVMELPPEELAKWLGEDSK